MIKLILESVLRPTIEGKALPKKEYSRGRVSGLTCVSECCGFIQSIARDRSSTLRKDSALLMALLSPLDALQKGNTSMGSPSMDRIVVASLTGLTSLIVQNEATEVLVEAMLQFVLKTLFSTEDKVNMSSTVQTAANNLVTSCVKFEGVSLRRQEQVARELASTENWTAWIELATLEEGGIIADSLDILKEKMADISRQSSQLTAMTALRTVLQKTAIPGPLAGLLLQETGSEVLVLFFQFGSLQVAPPASRELSLSACADAMKVLLLAHQQLASAEDELASFLELFFGAILAVLRCNGLPNHATPGGDPALGRMCAQAVLHIARAYPLPFKTHMASIAEHDRALLEFAVRAEMSGYVVEGASQQAAPTKKKLSLKGFQK